MDGYLIKNPWALKLILKAMKENWNDEQWEKVYNSSKLAKIVNILASSIGSLTNPTKIVNTFESKGIKGVSNKTISLYMDYLMEAFMINKAERYDIKGRKYISTPSKYYFSDKRYYIQSAFAIPDEAKMNQEKSSLVKIGDSFKKIIVVKDDIKLWRNEDGILIIGIQEFLLNLNSLDL